MIRRPFLLSICAAIIDQLPDRYTPVPVDVVRRSGRCLAVCAVIALDYKWTFYKHDIPVRDSILAGRKNSVVSMTTASPEDSSSSQNLSHSGNSVDTGAKSSSWLRRLLPAPLLNRGGHTAAKCTVIAEGGSGTSADQPLSSDSASVASISADSAESPSQAALKLEEAYAAHRACHERSANRLLWLCRRNAGLFVKIGQHLSSLNHVLPYVFTHRMSTLHQNAPVTPFDEVQRIIEEDMGAPLDEIFEEFNRTPLAAASLAQVHEAVLRWESSVNNEIVHVPSQNSSRRVAVKVQHPALQRQFNGDMWAHKAVLQIAAWLFPNFSLTWTHDEVHDGLGQELDFRREAANANRTRSAFQSRHGHNGFIHVPEVYQATPRTLTLEFIDGVTIIDREQLSRWGFSPPSCASAAMRVAAEQLFLDGFLHCDVHPGNIFVRPHPGDASRYKDQFQLVLLDHGLYRELSEPTRLAYARFWRSMVLGDDVGAEHSAHALGIDDWELFAVMTLARPYRNGFRGVLASMMPSESERFRKEFFKDRQLSDVMETMKAMPRELLLVMRTLNYLRYLDKELGSSANRFATMARIAAEGSYPRAPYSLSTEDDANSLSESNSSTLLLPSTPGSNGSFFSSLVARARFEFQLFIFESWIFVTDFAINIVRKLNPEINEAMSIEDEFISG